MTTSGEKRIEMGGLIFALLVLAGLIGGGILGYRYELKSWNGGHCLKCYARWMNFDQDSQGSRGYKCGNGHHIWISYSGIDGH